MNANTALKINDAIDQAIRCGEAVEDVQRQVRVALERAVEQRAAEQLRVASRVHAERTIEAIRTPLSSSPVYEVPDWSIRTHQTIKCGKSGVRYQQDSRHASWIRREAKKRGLKASVTLGSGGVAHVRLTPA